MRLQDKVILVTASTRGIGLAIAKNAPRKALKFIWPPGIYRTDSYGFRRIWSGHTGLWRFSRQNTPSLNSFLCVCVTLFQIPTCKYR